MTPLFTEAVRLLLEAELRCPKCGQSNTPKAVQVHLAANGLAFCDVCAHDWRAKERISA